jgi:hypothetical protein
MNNEGGQRDAVALVDKRMTSVMRLIAAPRYARLFLPPPQSSICLTDNLRFLSLLLILAGNSKH